jgi:azurin
LTAVLLLSFAVNAETVEVGIAGNDTMQFDKKAFTVVSGDTVKITFKNTGNLPKIAMGHNLLILAKGVAPSTLAGPSAGAAATEYIPASMKDKILAHTKLLGPQESDTITFTAPAAGSYYFMCSFPGHFALMNGIMTVK